MNLIDLFCGCGGFSLGAHQAGFDVSVAIDIDAKLTSSFSRNFPDTELHLADISTLSGEEICDLSTNEIDGIIGGPPCQGFSGIGRRDKHDTRRDLLGHFFRIVSEIRPTFFVMENVPGLAFESSKTILDECISTVSDHYHILGPHIWDASDFGASTKRRRIFVIGIDKDRGTPLSIDFVNKRMAPKTNVFGAISDLQNARFIEEEDEFDRWKIAKRGRPSQYAASMRSQSGDFTGHRPTKHTAAVIQRFSEVNPGQTDKIGRHPRLSWSGQCPTLRAGTGSDRGSYQSVRPIHPVENRVITVREAARIQGFPDDHLFHPTVWHSFRMIGNSVSPIIGKAILGAIKEHLQTFIENTPSPGENCILEAAE